MKIISECTFPLYRHMLDTRKVIKCQLQRFHKVYLTPDLTILVLLRTGNYSSFKNLGAD